MSDMNRTAIEEEGLSSVTGGSGDSPARFGAICPACRKPLAGMMYSDWRGGLPQLRRRDLYGKRPGVPDERWEVTREPNMPGTPCEPNEMGRMGKRRKALTDGRAQHAGDPMRAQ